MIYGLPFPSVCELSIAAHQAHSPGRRIEHSHMSCSSQSACRAPVQVFKAAVSPPAGGFYWAAVISTPPCSSMQSIAHTELELQGICLAVCCAGFAFRVRAAVCFLMKSNDFWSWVGGSFALLLPCSPAI